VPLIFIAVYVVNDNELIAKTEIQKYILMTPLLGVLLEAPTANSQGGRHGQIYKPI
jgi:hypothetical protein